ncbi:MAG TPA: hypothetical protein DDX54_02285 [Rhodospirillaceae bacterium]|nr:hypothetical protein [Rhodospirillaceae bacterium]
MFAAILSLDFAAATWRFLGHAIQDPGLLTWWRIKYIFKHEVLPLYLPAALATLGIAGMWFGIIARPWLASRWRGWASWLAIALIACGVAAVIAGQNIILDMYPIWRPDGESHSDLIFILIYISIVPWILAAWGLRHIWLFLRAGLGVKGPASAQSGG